VQSTQRRWRKFETKISFRFSDLLLRSPPFGAALFSDDRVIGGTRFSVNDPNDKNDIFSSGDQLVPWKTRLKCQRFQASRAVSSIWDFCRRRTRAPGFGRAFDADKSAHPDHFGEPKLQPTQFRRIFFGLAGWIDIDSAPMRLSALRA
jgi:hypothetical protein